MTDADYNDIQTAFSRAFAAFSRLSDQDFDVLATQNILLHSWQTLLLLSYWPSPPRLVGCTLQLFDVSYTGTVVDFTPDKMVSFTPDRAPQGGIALIHMYKTRIVRTSVAYSL